MKIFTGKVVSLKNNKTANVEVERIVSHPVYKKSMKKTKKYHVHDEIGTKLGDVVKFVATAPISKTKRHKILEIIKK
ncbi:30S ribosomal protein S17 [Candidatus Woesebacteria bacterium]|nr:30S ribosomal protein S17 [Candidatus Woesebacteria bacterium]QQG47790.1 MAG: 30S ribosomal protein S17 [Candidatus Woesebacteria bacterium]